MRVMLFVMRNLNREEQWGMTRMCFHWKEPHARKREERKKKRIRRNVVANLCPEGALVGPKRKTNVIVHWLSLCQTSLTNWFLVSLPVSPPPFSLSLLPRDSVCSGGQWHSSERAPVVPPFCTHGFRLCHQVIVRRGLQRAGSWSPNQGSLWMGGSRKLWDKHLEGQKKRKENAKKSREWHKHREDIKEKRRSWSEKGRQRMSESEMEKNTTTHFEN